MKILISFGCRPEIIKLYPVIEALKAYKNVKTILVNTGQQKDLSDSFVKQLGLRCSVNLGIMKENQTLNHIMVSILRTMDDILNLEKPDIVVVQGDTTTAASTALAAFNRRIPVAHVEAGLRTYYTEPYPEEVNRRLIASIAKYHFCPTALSEENLWNEQCINIYSDLLDKNNYEKPESWVVGNTSIDVVKLIKKPASVKKNYKRILLTLHRKENIQTDIGHLYLLNLVAFLENWNPNNKTKVKCDWITHPNSDLCKEFNAENLNIIAPLSYSDFIKACYQSDLILSDSGGVQEEATVIKTPLFILRKITERPEVLVLPFVQLISQPDLLYDKLFDFFNLTKRPSYAKVKIDFYGDGTAGKKIAYQLSKL